MANGPMEPGDAYGDGTVDYPVTGSFVYDADTNTYSSVSIVTAFRTWTDANLAVFVQSATKLVLIDNVTGEGLGLSFLNSLTNSGGTITLKNGFTFIDCIVSDCGSVEGAEEGPMTWTLQGVTTEGGVPWTGSFDWVACSPSSCYLNINIVSGLPGFSNPVDTVSIDILSAGCTDPATDSGVTLGPDAAGFQIFCMDFVSELTPSGGTIDLVTGGTGWATVGVSEVITGGAVSSPPVGGPYYFAGAVTTVDSPVQVDIDIQSGQSGNRIHTNHNDVNVSPYLDDVVAVGVLGSMTSVGDPVDFDTDTINPATLAFGPSGGGIDPASTPQFNENVDGDGIDDAVFDFLNSDSGIGCGDTSATLTGETNAGQAFEGTGPIQTRCNATCHK